MIGVQHHPVLDRVTEGDQQGGEGHRHDADGNEAQGHDAGVPESPRAARETIGAAEALHERESDAHGAKQGDDDRGPDQL